MEYSSILVPVNGSSLDEAALKLACSMADVKTTQIIAMYVIELERTVSLDAEIDSRITAAEEVLENARAILEKNNLELETDILQARDVGSAIIDEAEDRDVDLIVMAIGYKKHFGVFELGEVVPYVLREAHCPVLLVRDLPY